MFRMKKDYCFSFLPVELDNFSILRSKCFILLLLWCHWPSKLIQIYQQNKLPVWKETHAVDFFNWSLKTGIKIKTGILFQRIYSRYSFSSTWNTRGYLLSDVNSCDNCVILKEPSSCNLKTSTFETEPPNK